MDGWTFQKYLQGEEGNSDFRSGLEAIIYVVAVFGVPQGFMLGPLPLSFP